MKFMRKYLISKSKSKFNEVFVNYSRRRRRRNHSFHWQITHLPLDIFLSVSLISINFLPRKQMRAIDSTKRFMTEFAKLLLPLLTGDNEMAVTK